METAEPKRSKRAEPLEQRPSGTAEISCGSPSRIGEARLLEGGEDARKRVHRVSTRLPWSIVLPLTRHQGRG